MTRFNSIINEKTGAGYRAATILVLGLSISPAAGAEDFATLFDDDFKGVSLDLPDLQPAPRSNHKASDFSAISVPGFQLSAEELSLVMKATSPLGDGNAETNPVKPAFRERFVSWLTRRSNQSSDTSIFSTLVRESDKPGIRVDFDTSTDEVSLGYQIGF